VFEPSGKTQAQQNATAGYISLASGLLLVAGVFVIPIVFHKADGSPQDWFPLAAVAGVVLGCVFVFSGGWAIYDARPIPSDPIRAPTPLQLTHDEAWRKPTPLRFLEKLKKELTDIENQVRQDYDKAVQAYEKLPHSSGRFDYDRHKRTLEYSVSDIDRAQDRRLPALRLRIEKIFAGDVNAEILDLEENTRKLQRNKQEHERGLQKAETPCTINHKDQDEVQRCEKRP
jgi:hypothetical protein